MEFGGDSILAVHDDQVGVSVTVDIHDPAHPTAVVGKLTSGPIFAFPLCLGVDPRRSSLDIAVGVGKHDVHVAVVVDVKPVDHLDNALCIHIEVISAVVE